MHTHTEKIIAQWKCASSMETINPELLNDGHIQGEKKWVYSCLQKCWFKERGAMLSRVEQSVTGVYYLNLGQYWIATSFYK